MNEKTCATCVNCGKLESFWSCENYSGSLGMPVKVNPPYDKPCENYSENPEDIDKAADALRDFVDHFWDDID